MMFNKTERTAILTKIQYYEAQSNSVIHVHVRKKCQTDVLTEAKEYFLRNKLHHTIHSNAVLIFIAEKSHNFAILGDKNSHAHMQQSFWDDNSTLLSSFFKKGEFLPGMLAVIDNIGQALIQHFPKNSLNKSENNITDDVTED